MKCCGINAKYLSYAYVIRYTKNCKFEIDFVQQS